MCSQRTMGLIALGFGLIATGGLALAVATDFWLYINESVPFVPSGNLTTFFQNYMDDLPPEGAMFPEGEPEGEWEAEPEGGDAEMDPLPEFPLMDNSIDPDDIAKLLPETITIKSHSGLWRVCLYNDDEPDYMEGAQKNILTTCTSVSYGQTFERIEDADTTMSILRAIRRATPVIVVSLLILIVAFGLSTVGNTKQDIKTLVGAVFYIFSALTLAIGVIFYISAVNDEVSHRKTPTTGEQPSFIYWYGWAFFFAGSAFICAMAASVANITLYVKRYPNLEDMVLIVPGLEKKSAYDFGGRDGLKSGDEHECDSGTHNPTIIL